MSPKSLTRWHHKILFPLISVGLFLCLFELICWGLNLSAPKPPPFKFVVSDFDNDVEYPFMIEDPTLWWAPKPNFTGQSTSYGYVYINSAGFRDREYPLQKAPGVFRILCLGDSTTFGFGVPNELTYHSLLEEMLNQNNRQSGIHYEVINGGVTGYSSLQCRLLYKHRGEKLRPDLVLLNVGPNDSYRRSHLSDADIMRSPVPSVLKTINNGLLNLHSYRTLYRIRRDVTKEGMYNDSVEKVPRVNIKSFKQNIAKIDEACRADGCQLVLISFPHCGQIIWLGDKVLYNAIFPNYRKALETIANEQHIPLVTSPILTEKSTEPNLELFIDKLHPNQKGHAVLAGAIMTFLKNRGYLPETDNLRH